MSSLKRNHQLALNNQPALKSKFVLFVLFLGVVFPAAWNPAIAGANHEENLALVYPMFPPDANSPRRIIEVRIYENNEGAYDQIERALTEPGKAGSWSTQPTLRLEMDLLENGKKTTVEATDVIVKSSNGQITGLFGNELYVGKEKKHMNWSFSTPFSGSKRAQIQDREPEIIKRYFIDGFSGNYTTNQARENADQRKEAQVIVDYPMNPPVGKNGIYQVVVRELMPGLFEALQDAFSKPGSPGQIIENQKGFEVKIITLVAGRTKVYKTDKILLKIDAVGVLGLMGNELETVSTSKKKSKLSANWGVDLSNSGFGGKAYISPRDDKKMPYLNGYARDYSEIVRARENAPRCRPLF